jgi:V/A-type H+/Na+-transporting ATPase subunit D
VSGPGQAPTRAAVLELREELGLVTEAYNFLDEKRLLLAAEIIRQLEYYESLLARMKTLSIEANRLLASAVERHGLQGLTVYPAGRLTQAELETKPSNFMGVKLIETALLKNSAADLPYTAANPSQAAEECRAVFVEIIDLGAVMAGVSGNLHRLGLEYRITERRARALENVILPEIEQSLRQMSGLLEELDMEDAIRARTTFGMHHR